MIEEICTEHGVKLHLVERGDDHCLANGEDSYVDSSFCCGCIDHDPEIWVGIYEDEELRLISFFHELGHVLDTAPQYKTRYTKEMRAWEIGLSYAHNIMGLSFSDNAMGWAMKQLETYRGD